MATEVWKEREVAAAFLNERSVHIPDRRRQLEVMLRVLRNATAGIRRVLDLGCGDGILLSTALEAFPEAEGVAVDFSALMLEQARRRLVGFDRRARTAEADLQFPLGKQGIEGPFDAVLSGLAIHHLTHERKRALYGEIFELLPPGGVFVNLEHVAAESPRGTAMFEEMMSEHLYQRRKEKGEAVTPEQVRRDYLERPDKAANILAPVEDQCRWLREIGFADVECFWKFFDLAVFGGFRPL